MRVRCDYCRSYISDIDEFCPYCLAPNSKLKRVSNNVPITIDDLKKWYVDHNLPNEEITRFFIGKNTLKPKAFGIYFDEKTNLYIVYKNKSDGTRVVRYEGKDEAYAVNEIYIKLKEEISNQKSHNNSNSISYNNKKRKKGCFSGCLLSSFRMIIMVFVFIAFLMFGTIIWRDKGYYKYKDTIYYLVSECNVFDKKNCNWYKYNDSTDDWEESNYPKGISLVNKIKNKETLEITTDITMHSGYYYYNNEIYYSYNQCERFDTNNCEWYKYDAAQDTWSIINYIKDIKSNNYVGSFWTNIDSKEIKTQYYEEEWYRKLHPQSPSTGYYLYNDNTYYYYRSAWYIYNNGWSPTSVSEDLDINHADYYETNYNSYSQGIDELFTDSNYYKQNSYNNDSSYSSSDYDSSDWDSSSSWNSSDSWDSNYTDWDSDW